MDDVLYGDWSPCLPRNLSENSWQIPWLKSKGSLTKKIKHIAGDDFNLKLLSQHKITIDKFHKQFPIDDNTECISRQILLCKGDMPLIFAHSILPIKALNGRFEELKDLGEKPLGHWIFSEPKLTRKHVEFLAVNTASELFKIISENVDIQATDIIYGRRSIFYGADYPLLVSEFFLPNLKHY